MVGIGFFAPLPLALMMPFMAGQSMLMGDAFGKAYQYGKRKISAMTNEEFNKLTPAQLGQEIQTDYAAMIPSLQTAIKQSSAFQSLIIQELASIVRSLPKDIVSGFTGDSVNPVSTITQQATSENIDYGKIAIATLKIMLGPISSNFNIPGFGSVEAAGSHSDITPGLRNLQFATIGGAEGPPDPTLEVTIYNSMTRAELLKNQPSQDSWIKAQPNYAQYQIAWQIAMAKLEPKTTTPPPPISSFAGQSDATKPEALAWISKRDNLINKFLSAQKVQGGGNNAKLAAAQMKNSLQTLRQMSNDYRHPNEFIRSQALILRKLISRNPFV